MVEAPMESISPAKRVYPTVTKAVPPIQHMELTWRGGGLKGKGLS